MAYYFSTALNQSFESSIDRVTRALEAEGFGVLTEIDVKETMKKKLGEDFRKYRILGACNPPFAYRALETEDKIGTMLPCNVIVQEHEPNVVEVAAINPVSSMQAVENESLEPIAAEIGERLQRVIASLRDEEKTADEP